MTISKAKIIISIPILCILMFLTPNHILAQSRLERLGGNVQHTLVSGDSGDGFFELTPSNRGPSGQFGPFDAALAGLQWDEQADIPCGVSIFRRDLNTGVATVGNKVGEHDGFCSFVGNGMGSNLTSVAEVILGNGERQVYIPRNRRFVRGVQVCRNYNNRRMKGVRIFAAHVSTAGAVSVVNGRQEAKMPNCGASEWVSPVYCNEGRIAFGLRVHYMVAGAGAGDRKITGLSLNCFKVRST